MGFDSVVPAPVSKKSNCPFTGGNNSVVSEEDTTSNSNKKIRKPYTITKSRQNWTDVEHDKFLEALHLFDRDWKKIEAFVGSKTAIQIRSHAQKYFLKVQKNGANEHVPPPRPKKKAAHPYPLKAPKQDDVISSSIDSGTGIWPTGETNDQNEVKQRMFGRVMPDFPKVYRFIGGIFDPNESNHLQKLKMMDPVDVETGCRIRICQHTTCLYPSIISTKRTKFWVSSRKPYPNSPLSVSSSRPEKLPMKLSAITPVVLLMRNLCANLESPQFEDYRRLLSSYDPGTGKVASNSSFSGLQALPGNAILSS